MSDLTVDVKRTFGEYLPTSFIKKIDIKRHATNSEKYSVIEVTVDVNFTIKKEIINYKEAAAKHFKDLYLYILFNKSPIIFEQVKNKKLEINRLLQFNSTISETAIGFITARLLDGGASVTRADVVQTLRNNTYKRNLSNLKDKIVEEGLYDSNGDRILKISNVKFRATFLNVLMEEMPAAAVYTFVGRHDGHVKNLPASIAKRNFGDIAYELALVRNVVPDTTQEIYVDASGMQYTKTPLQTIQGSYHISEPIAHANIINSIRNLSTAYAETVAESNETFTVAAIQLAYLLATSEGEIKLLPELNLYRKAYPDKSNASIAGRFYSLFKRRLLKLNRIIALQDRVYKKLVLNSKTSDLRGVDAETYNVITPSPDPDSLGTAGNDLFISKKMFNIDRTTQLTIPLDGAVSDFVQFVSEEGISTASDAVDMWNAKYDFMFAASLDEQRKEVKHDVEASAAFKKAVPNQIEPIKDADTVVKNKGLFFFDYERALHVKSAIAKVFRLDYLQRFLGTHVPYDYFRLKDVTLGRKESTFVTQNFGDGSGTWGADPYWFSSPGEELPGGFIPIWDTTYGGVERVELSNPDVASVEIKATFDPSASYPLQDRSNWKITCHQHESFLSYGMPYVYKYIYGALPQGTGAGIGPSTYNDPGMDFYSGVTTGGLDLFYFGTDSYLGVLSVPAYARAYMATANGANKKARALSYLKFKNFDLPRRNYQDRLSGYNGSKVRQGYRLMCFEFQDFMDDDVAYYNTIGTTYGNRETFHTFYHVLVNAEDHSLKLYWDIKDFIEKEYLKFLIYFEKAKEACSYNNIDDVFNEFFIKAMNDLEEEGMMVSWYRAPTIYYSVMAVITNMYNGIPVDDIQTHIINDVTTTAGSISPQTGRMSELEVFKQKFEHLLGMFGSNIIDASLWGPQAEAIYNLYLDAGGTPVGESIPSYMLQFMQSRRIEEEIFGNLYLSAWHIDDISPSDIDKDLVAETEPDLDLGDGIIKDFGVDVDAHLKGWDFKIVMANWYSKTRKDRHIKIFAGEWWPESDFFGDESWEHVPAGYTGGEELRELAGGTRLDYRESVTVYLPPGRWTIAWSDTSIGSRPESGGYGIQCMTCIVPVNEASPNRIKRSSGSGWEYTQSGKGPATIVYPCQNGKTGGGDGFSWTEDNDYLLKTVTWGGDPTSFPDDGEYHNATYYQLRSRGTGLDISARFRKLKENMNWSTGDTDGVHWSMYQLKYNSWWDR